MAYRLGENLQREWDADPCASQLWETVGELDTNPSVALAHLEALAGRGSALAMMYLGDTNVYGRSQLPVDKEAGELWLRRSAKAGSIEGRFRLATLLEREKRNRHALVQWQKLAELGYAPAIFYIGYCYYKGHLGFEVDRAAAHAFWQDAYQKGHLHSAHWLASSFIDDDFGAIKKFSGIWIKLKCMVPFVWHFVQFPTSDRLRMPWRMKELDARLDRYEEEHGVAG